MKTSKIILSILDIIVVAWLGISSFKLALYFSNQLYHSNYIQNILNTDLTQLNVFEILMGTDGGTITLFVGSLALFTMGLKFYNFIRTKIIILVKFQTRYENDK